MISETYDNDIVNIYFVYRGNNMQKLNIIKEYIRYHLNNFLRSLIYLKQARHTIFHHMERT